MSMIKNHYINNQDLDATNELKAYASREVGKKSRKNEDEDLKGGNEMIKEDANRNADLDNSCLFLRFYC